MEGDNAAVLPTDTMRASVYALAREHLDEPLIATLREVLASAGWQSALRELPGYLPFRSGEVLSLKDMLPWWHYRGPKAPTR